MNELIDQIKKKNVILFVGAGVSNSLGLPTWNQLIRQMAVDLEFDPDIFESLGDNLTLAEFYILGKNIGSLRSWMDREWHNPGIDIKASEIHQAIVNLDFPIIYTTNYDRWIEKAYIENGLKDKIVKIADVSEISKIKDGLTQIIKFHGDFDEDKSIVLSETSYFERLSFETPLDIKLRSDTLGKSILFIGYSLKDINIRFLLYKLSKVWENSSNPDARPRSFIFLNRPNPVQERVLEKRGIKTLVAEKDDPKEGLGFFLDSLLKNVKP